MEALVAYLHYLSIILTAGFLVGELVLCRPGLARDTLRLLPRLDIAYFVAALGALATGLLRLFFYGKGLAFYLPNPFFLVKVGLFLVIAGVSVAPTLRFRRWARTAGGGPSPDEVRSVRRLIHIELGLLALMPLMAVLMARGIGR